MIHVGALAKREPRKPTLRHTVSNERPATIASETMPGHVSLGKPFGSHRLDRVTPQSDHATDTRANAGVMHESSLLLRGALAMVTSAERDGMRSAAAPLDRGS